MDTQINFATLRKSACILAVASLSFSSMSVSAQSLLGQLTGGPLASLADSAAAGNLQPTIDATVGDDGLVKGVWGTQLNDALTSLNQADLEAALSQLVLDPEPALSGISVLMNTLANDTLPRTSGALSGGNLEGLVDAAADDLNSLSFGSTPGAINETANGVVTGDPERVENGIAEIQNEVFGVMVPALIGPDS